MRPPNEADEARESGDRNRAREIAQIFVGVEQADEAIPFHHGGEGLVLFAEMAVDARGIRGRFGDREIEARDGCERLR